VQKLPRGRSIIENNSISASPLTANTRRVSPSTPSCGDHHRLAYLDRFHQTLSKGKPQWPPEDALPGFRDTFTRYIQQVEDLSFQFIQLLAESLRLHADAFNGFYDEPKGAMQHRSKVVKYPEAPPESNQGVGPHYDSGFLTFVCASTRTMKGTVLIIASQLLQASEQLGLEVQNVEGEWIPVPPKVQSSF
jgi:isopenicillin N synthase-like dioxygenase